MKRLFILILLLTSMGSFAQKKLVLKVPAVASGGGGASLPAKVFYTSQQGLVSDADLSMSSTGAGTNNTAALNTLLAQASATQPVIIYVDGMYRVDSIRLRTNTALIGVTPGAGFVQGSTVSSLFVHNYSRSKNPYAITDENIVIENLTLNGTGYTSGAFNKAKQSWENMYHLILHFAGAKNIRVKNVTLLNGRAYAWWNTNIRDFVFENITIQQNPNTPYGTLDGLDLVGNIYNGVVRNLTAYTRDDAFALATAYGWQSDDVNGTGSDGGGEVPDYYPYASLGPVRDILIDGITFDSTTQGIRVMSVDTQHDIDRITFRNIKGEITDYYIAIIDNYTRGGTDPTSLIWHTSPGITGNVGKITFEDVNVAGGRGFYIGGLTADELVFNNVTKDGTLSDPIIEFDAAANIRQVRVNGLKSRTTSTQPLIELTGNAVVAALSLDGVTYDRGATTYADAQVVKINPGHVANLRLSGVESFAAGPVVRFTSGTLTRMQAANIAMWDAPDVGILHAGGTVAKLTLSNFDGDTTHTGTVTATAGDAFASGATGGGATGGTSGGGLGAMWAFEETASPSQDATDTDADLTWAGGVSSTTGKVGNAVALNGSTGYLTTPDHDSLSYTTSGFAIAGWFKITADGPNDYQYLLHKGLTGDNTLEYQLFYDEVSHVIKSTVTGNGNPGTSTAEVSTPFAADNAWHFICVNWNTTTNKPELTIDNGTTVAGTNPASITGIYKGAGALYVGAYTTAVVPLSGAVDQLRIYNRTLTATEITALYNGGAGQ